MNLEIRAEHPADAKVVRQVTEAAFETVEHSAGTEGAIVDALREADALTVSLVALVGDEVVGHVAFSPVTIGGRHCDWFGLGPVSVRPEFQRKGIGDALIRQGLDRLRRVGARGCVVLGEPAYYARFGFATDARLLYPGVPAEYFQRLRFEGTLPEGKVEYHSSFAAT